MENLILSDLYELAKSAYYGTSFDPERRAKSIIEGHSEELSNDLNKIPESERERYEKNYRKHLSDYLQAHSRCYSSMIAGPSNFPVERMRKYSNWADNKLKLFIDWREKALKAIDRKIEKSKSPEQKLNERWVKIRENILSSVATILAIDQGIEKGYSRPLFVNGITRLIQTLAKNGETELVNKSLTLIDEINTKYDKPIISGKNKIWELRQAAEAKREQIEDNLNRENSEIEINGVKIVQNWQADRMQLFFQEIPSHEIRTKLKKSGWHWSRFNGCWQRKNTNNAFYNARKILSN